MRVIPVLCRTVQRSGRQDVVAALLSCRYILLDTRYCEFEWLLCRWQVHMAIAMAFRLNAAFHFDACYLVSNELSEYSWLTNIQKNKKKKRVFFCSFFFHQPLDVHFWPRSKWIFISIFISFFLSFSRSFFKSNIVFAVCNEGKEITMYMNRANVMTFCYSCFWRDVV